MRAVSTRLRIGAVASAAAALCAAAITAPAAQAGPNTWTQLSSGGLLVNTDEPSAARVGTKLHVVWQEESAGNKANLRSRAVAANGVAAGGITPVVSGWNTLVHNPAIVASGGKPVVVFAGLREGWAGQLKTATLADGVKWTEGTAAVGQHTSAYAGYGTAAVDDAGTLVSGTNGGGSSVNVNRGVPAAGPDIENDQRGSAVDLALARDKATGQVWSAWHNLANPADPVTVKGIGVQPVYPAVGARSKAPGSTDAKGNAITSDGRMALAARNAADGGVWLAYRVGYPTSRTIRVWKVGTSIYRTVTSPGDVRFVSLSPGNGGRLWLSWYDRTNNVIRATRSDATVKSFGAVRSIAPPARRGGETQVWNLTADGSLGPLDIVATAATGTGNGAIQVWHQQIQPALAVQVAPVAVRSATGGTATVTVTDAGAPVGGARVTVLGRAYTTNARGQIAVAIPRRTPVGLQRVNAARAGYFAGFANLRIS